MAQDDNDMSGEAAFAGESAATRKVRSKFENVPISANESSQRDIFCLE